MNLSSLSLRRGVHHPGRHLRTTQKPSTSPQMIHIKPERQNDEMRSRLVLNLRHHRKLHTRALGSPPTLRDTAIASSVGWNKQKSYPLSNFLILRGIIDYIEARNTLAKQTVYLIQALSRSSEQKQRAELEKCECHLRRRRRRR